MAASGPLASQVVISGQLKSCSEFGAPPYASYDANGKPVGFEIDVATEIASRLGLVADVTERQFATLIDAVANHDCDISIANQNITPSRLRTIDMIPYLKGTIYVVVRTGDVRIGKLVDLCGRKLAMKRGSIYADFVRGVGDYQGKGVDDQCRAAGRADVDVQEFDSELLAYGALGAAEVDAYVGDTTIVNRQPSIYALSVALEEVTQGIGVAKDHATLRDAVEAALTAMIADGTYKTILAGYGIPASHIPNR